MSAEFIWTLPTDQPGGLRRWVNVARAAELAGFQGLRVPSGPQRPDAWLVTARLAAELRQIRFMVELRPGLELPAVTAQRVATLHRLSGRRLELSLLLDVDAGEARSYGDAINHDDRFARATEYLQLLRQVWKGRGAGSGLQHAADFFRVEGGGLYRPLAEPPPLYIGGATPAAERLAAQQAQAFVHWAAPTPQLAERVARVRRLALQQGRSPSFACRVHLVAEATEAQARARALRTVGPTPRSLHGWQRLPMELAPHLWLGAGGEGAGGVSLIGSYAQVAEQLDAWQALGVERFILSSNDALDDSMRIAQEVLSLRRPAKSRVAMPLMEGLRS